MKSLCLLRPLGCLLLLCWAAAHLHRLGESITAAVYIGANFLLREVRVWMRAYRLRIDLARPRIRLRELVFELDRRCLATLLVASCSAGGGVLLARARAIVSHPEGTCWRGREEGWMREKGRWWWWW